MNEWRGPTPPLSRRQLLIGSAVAIAFFGYLTIAALFHENPTVWLLLIGPYGVSAGVWIAFSLGGLGLLARREKNRLSQ